MFSRLVLVGMVAALGITVPTRMEILDCIKAVHSWTASRLADWDSSGPSDDDGVIAAPILPGTTIERKSEAVTPPPGILVAVGGGEAAAESLEGRPRLALEPIVVADLASGLAHELNRWAERLEIALESANAARRVAVATTGLATKAGRRNDLGPLLAGDTVEEKLAMQWFRAVDGSDVAATPVTLDVVERRSSVAIPPISCTFSGSSTAERPARPVMTTPVVVGLPLVAATSKYDLITLLDDAVRDLAQQLNRFAEGVDGSELGALLADRARPAFVPIDPGPGLESGLALELNRASEGLAIVQAAGEGDDSLKAGSLVRDVRAPRGSTEGEGGTPPDSPSDVGVALRLTREAVHAWVNVLSVPPTVRMSAR